MCCVSGYVLSSSLTGDTWTGLNDNRTEGVLEWEATGRNVSYTNWEVDGDRNLHENDFCKVRPDDLEWKYFRDENNHYVCQNTTGERHIAVIAVE